MSNNLENFADELLEAYFSSNVKPKQRKPSTLDEIDWSEPDIAGTSTRCMSQQAVADFFNSEIERLASGKKANPSMPRISKGIMLGDDNTVKTPLEFAQILSKPPKTIFDVGEKSKHTIDDDIKTINTGIPALRGIVWDKENQEFRVINTCPGAGACAIDCYALQGFYIFNDGKNLKLAQRLQLIFTDPESYYNQAYREAEMFAFEAQRDNKVLEIRWNDAGDFFSERYLKLALRVTKTLLEKNYKVKSYFYTKVGGMVELGQKLGFTVTFSQGGSQETPAGVKKQSVVVPIPIVRDYITRTKGRGFSKDESGKTIVSNKEGLKKAVVDHYSKDATLAGHETITTDNTKFTDELPRVEGKDGEFNAIILPGGDSDAPAQRNDVHVIFLIKH